MEAKPALTYADGRGTSRARMRGRHRDILIAFFVMAVPMIVFSALLLGLIFHFRISHNGFASENLRFAREHDEERVIYVRLSATTLTTVASWSSTIAPILICFAVTLISYPVARTLLNGAMDNRPSELLTPYQLGLLLRIVDGGGLGALWSWIAYVVGWKGRRQAQPRALKMMSSILFLGIILSALVLITDTWLHFTTKTVNFTQTAPTSNPPNCSYALMENCTNVQTPYISGCTLNPAASATFNRNGAAALQLLNNVSDTMAVKTQKSGEAEFAYLGNAPQARLSAIDYTAMTWAVHTQCESVTSECMDHSKFFGAGTPFNCPFAFQGDLAKGGWYMAYFADSTASDNLTDSASFNTPINNPYYFALAAAVNEEVIQGLSPTLDHDPGVEHATHGALVFALFCNATVYDVEYTSVNNTLQRFIANPSNVSTTNIIEGTQRFSSAAGSQKLLQAASLAGLSKSSQELADTVAIAYSKVALSVAAAAFVPEPALEAQVRQNILAARVPKAPLVALLLSNLLLAALGIILTFIALIAVRGEAGEVQARLRIHGLVADRFEGSRARVGSESVEDLFEESKGQMGLKVGIVRTGEGGYAYGAWQPSQGMPFQA